MTDKVYFISVPQRIASLDIPASHKMVAGSIFTRTVQRDLTGFEKIIQRFIMEDWGIQETAITLAIRWLKENGFIETKRTRSGTLVRWVGEVREVCEDNDSRPTENKVPEIRDSRNTRIKTPEIRGLRPPENGDALLRLVPRLIPKPEEREGASVSVTECQSATTAAKLPGVLPLVLSGSLITKINAAFPNNPNAVLHQIRMAGWEEPRIEAALMKTDPARGVNYFTAICRRMTDAEVRETLAPPSVNTDRITTKDGKRVLKNGQWLEVKTPYPNQPAPGQDPPPRLPASNGNQKPPGRPLGGLLGGKMVEMSVEERAANGYGLAAREKEAAENRIRENEARQKAEADRAALKDLMKRRNERQNELVTQGKKLAEIGDILRKEGLAD